MAQLPPGFVVTEAPEGEFLCRLPRRPPGPMRYAGLVPLAIGAALTTSIALTALLFPEDVDGSGPFVVALGVAVGGYMALCGTLLFAGHAEVSVRVGRLLAAARCGPLRRCRGCPLGHVRGFRVTAGRCNSGFVSFVCSVFGANDDSTLVADLTDGGCLTLCRHYPTDWLLAFAGELGRRCAASAEGAPLPVTEDLGGPEPDHWRTEQPTDSNAVLEEEMGGLSIRLPPLGFRRSPAREVLGFYVFCNALLLLLSIGAVAVIRDQAAAGRTENPMTACLLMVVFWCAGVRSLLWALDFGPRWAQVTVAGGWLQITEVGLFQTRARAWPAGELTGFEVQTVSRDTGVVSHFVLGVEQRDGGAELLLMYRPRTELEWLATVVRRALGLPDPEAAPAPDAAGP